MKSTFVKQKKMKLSKQYGNNTELFFDDEKIEDVLYNENPPCPTPANIFLPIKERMLEIRRLFENESISAFSVKVLQLLESNLTISRAIYQEINGFLSRLIPDLIKPVLKHDIHDFGPIIENIWKFAQNNDLVKEFGNNVYRWYEHHRRYSEAREALEKLIGVAIRNKDRSNEALYKNNFAFDYLVEHEWKKAVSRFKEAAEIFIEENDMFNYCNSMANYWICETERANNIDDIKIIEKEIKSVEERLGKSIEEELCSGGNYWHHRKPYFLCAKLEERKGNIKNAILLVKKAIAITKGCQTSYPQEDCEYLEMLRKSL
jgi:tetratricopeptide (TPR) repeat protein